MNPVGEETVEEKKTENVKTKNLGQLKNSKDKGNKTVLTKENWKLRRSAKIQSEAIRMTRGKG